MAAGKLLGAGAGAAAAAKRNNYLTQGAREQSRAGMEAAGTTGDFLTQLRAMNYNPAAERAAFTGALGTPGVVAPMTGSARFRSDAAGATAGAQGYGRNLADLFARTRAPQQQRQGESQLLVRMGDALRPIQAQAHDDEFLTNLRAGSVQANPWQQLAGQGLSSLGSYYLGKKT